LLNYLGDPYGCIFDVDAGTEGGIVAGTGPYIAVECQSGDHLTLRKNEDYWNGTPHIDELTIRTISDGDTLAMALQSGEIDAAYGMAYESYPLFQGDAFSFSQIATSRAFFAWMNFESKITSDPAVRKAIAMGIDKESFVKNLLNGNGYPGNGVFPAGFAFGGDKVATETFDPEGAKKVLEDAGWTDTDGDGIREKDGVDLKIRWLTYPSRQELPLLAEAAQATLKEIGLDVEINSTADHNKIRVEPSQWDVYASAMVTAPTGDPEYFFTSCCLDSSAVNNGHFHSDKLEELEKKMAVEFDAGKRAELAIEMQKAILEEHGYVFCSFLQMSQICRKGVMGYTAHASDYYQVTADLDVQ
ncbi:MAG: ABC transporter substrate-binding protein, partial [Lachnospiraceae bacterium]|nr:ABC transporter substrate-binding protein [Lachnospiraceae bacterium]